METVNKFVENNNKKANIEELSKKTTIENTNNEINSESNLANIDIINVIEVVLPSKNENNYIADSFVNSLEIAVYDLQNESLNFNVRRYSSDEELNKIFSDNSKNGKIFIGPLTSSDTEIIKKYCNKNILIFSFASDRSLGKDCVFLFNFFIEDDLNAIFTYLNEKSKIALLYPNNKYGNYVNSIIDNYSKINESTLIYKIPYNEDLSDIREIIKQLGKYDFRKKELERQISLLESKKDEVSLASLKKLKRFETIGELDFTHLIISDGNIRILELAPLLPFYDIDPNRIKFIGTGLWDEKSFFDEPSLQGAIFPGTEFNKRKEFEKKYMDLFLLPPPRTSTIIYDVSSLINYLTVNYENFNQINVFLNNNNKFVGLDGRFSIENNLIKRELSILKIQDGKAEPTM